MSPGVARSIRPRTTLPSSRAVVGGLLVTLAAIGTWVTASGATQGTGTRYLVAAEPIGAGQRIGPDDVRWSTLELPGSLHRRAFTSSAAVMGTVALGPLEPGDLLQAGGIAPAAGAVGEREVSFTVDTDRAVAGALRAGDRIDLYATVDAADGATSAAVLTDVTIRRIGSSDGDGLGDERRQVITIAIGRTDDAEAVVTATRSATLTVLRATGTEGRGGR